MLMLSKQNRFYFPFRGRLGVFSLTVTFLILSCFISLFAAEPRVTSYGGKQYFLRGDDIEVAIWKNGALGVYTSIHDDWGSNTLGGVYKHLDSISMNRGIVSSSGAITGSCGQGMIDLAKKYISHGHEIFAHSVTHTDGMSRSEIFDSKAFLEREFGVPCGFYIFPFDQWNDEAIGYVKEAGYLGCRAGDRTPAIDANRPHELTNPYDFEDPYRILFDVFPRYNSGYKNVPDNGDNTRWLKQYVSDAVKYNSWAVHEFHDISRENNLSIPLEEYQSLMDHVGELAADNRIWTSGPSEVIRYRFTREYCGTPSLTANSNGYTLSFGNPTNVSELNKFKTKVSVFFKTSNVDKYIRAYQNGEELPSTKISNNYFSVYVDPTEGSVSIEKSNKPYSHYPFLYEQDISPSTADAWNPAVTYFGGEIVYYAGREYRARYWTLGNKPTDAGSPWADYDDLSGVAAVAARASKGGSISPVGKTIVSKGSNITYTFTPASGYVIDYVNVDMENIGRPSSYTFSNIQESHAIEVIYSQPYEDDPVVAEFTISASATTGGRISPEGTISVEKGDAKTFQAIADAGYTFDGWIVDGNVVSGSSYTFHNVNANHSIKAQFSSGALPTYDIVASAIGNGSISPSGTTTINEGANQSYAITADSGYEIDVLTVNGSAVSATGTYTFTDVTADQSISVTFKKSSDGDMGDVQAWSASESWTSYSVGDKRSNGGSVWECINTGFAIYEPSGPYGHYGWKKL